MKRALAVVLFFVAGLAGAADDLTVNLNAVRFADLVRVVLDDIGGGSLIVSPEVLTDVRELSFVVKKTTSTQVLEQLKTVASGLGYSVQQSGGVWFVGPASEDQNVVVYTPKSKPVSYLQEIVQGVVPGVKFSTTRAINSTDTPPATVESAPGTAGALVGKAQKELLVLTVPKAREGMLRSLLDQIDLPTREIEVKAMLVEIQRGETKSNAINFLLSLFGGKFGIEWTGGAEQARGVSVKIGAIDALWSALETDRRFNVISAPRLRVKSGESARFSVGSEVPVLGAVTYQASGQAVQSVDYRPAGVILDLAPKIHAEHAEITIKQQLSNFVKTETGVNNSPTLLKRELQTVVTARQGELVVLGGLDEAKESSDRSGFFFLPSALRSQGEDSSCTEIVMLIYLEKFL